MRSNYGGLNIQNYNKNDIGYITAFFPAFLPGTDIFQIFIIVAAIIVIILGASALYRKKKSSEKVNRRISSLRREFNNVKAESFNESETNWIKDRLDEEDPDLEDMIPANKR